MQGSGSGSYTWEQAKRSSDSPRAVGALLEPHLRAEEDLREREGELRSDAVRAEQSGDAHLIYRAQHRLGLQLEAGGSLAMAADAVARAVAASSANGSMPGARAAATNDHGILLARLGRTADALEQFESAAAMAAASEQAGLNHAVLRNLGLLAWLDGRPGEGLDRWSNAFGGARDADDAAANAQILNNVAVLRLLEGEGQEAMQLFNRAILLAQRGGDIRGLAFTYNNLGLVFAGPPRGDHFAAIPFVEMALALLTGPVDILGRLYVLNNNILVYEQAHLEPARKFRAQFAETLKFFNRAYPQRAADIERTAYGNGTFESTDSFGEDEWEIFDKPVLLRPCSRCGVQNGHSRP